MYKLEKDEIPEAIQKVDPLSFFVPHYHGHGEGTYFRGTRDDPTESVIRLMNVKSEKKGDQHVLVADLEFVYKKEILHARVRKGDLLVLPKPLKEVGLRVLNIVPKEGKIKTIGWVELDSAYVDADRVEAEATERKCNLVKFIDARNN